MPRAKKWPAKRKRIGPKKKKSSFIQSSFGRSYGVTVSRTPQASAQKRTMVLHDRGTIGISAAVGLANTFGFTVPGVSFASNFDLVNVMQLHPRFTNLQNLYREYRIKGFKMRFVEAAPLNQPVAGPSNFTAEGGVVVCWSQQAPGGLYTTIAETQGAKIFSIHRDWEFVCSPVAIDSPSAKESFWDTLSTPTSGYYGYIGGCLTTGSVAATAQLNTVGSISLEVTIELRGLLL